MTAFFSELPSKHLVDQTSLRHDLCAEIIFLACTVHGLCCLYESYIPRLINIYSFHPITAGRGIYTATFKAKLALLNTSSGLNTVYTHD
jgi:hypothetical protein